jgi:[protein-PII] uridylyltransferase
MKTHLEPTTESSQATQAYLETRQRLIALMRSHPVEPEHGLLLAFELCDATDAWITELWAAASGGEVEATLLALGGYGRRELCFSSDVDLVLEVDPSVLGTGALLEAVERFVAWCREPRVKVAHAVRTQAQTHASFSEDFRTAVSYLDVRALSGEPSKWQFEAAKFLRADELGVGFVRDLFAGYKHRHERYGQTIYRLEPDLKNGPGGMRDLHVIRWAAMVCFETDILSEDTLGFGEEQRDAYVAGQAWLLRLRLFMHAVHCRKHDRLNFADQETIARMTLGAGDGVMALHDATESLMRDHYRVAKNNLRMAERLLRLWGASGVPESHQSLGGFWVGGGLIGSDAEIDAAQVLEILAYASSHPELYLEASLESKMEDAIETMAIGDTAFSTRLREVLSDIEAAPVTIGRVLDLGLLVRLLPEFEPLICHVHHDVYHVYTTDVHSIRCLEAGRSLLSDGSDSLVRRFPYLAEIVDGLNEQDVFLIACLLHDIGKNRGGDHSRKGAAMMADIGPRLGFDDEQTALLVFMVREHLSLSRIARRRDLGDIRIIRDVASMVRTTSALRALTLLTFCDMATVGDDVLNDWNASLLFSLYQRVKTLLDHGAESLWHEVEAIVAARKLDLASSCEDERGAGALNSAIDGFLRDLPVGHIIDTPVDGLIRQFEVYRLIGRSDAPVIEIAPDEGLGTTEVIVAAKDVPGALADITGTLSACGLNILSAQIVTTGSGRTLDIFRVARSGGASHVMSQSSQAALVDPRRIAQVKEKLEKVLTGQIRVQDLLTRRINEQRLPDRPLPSVETQVRAVEDASEHFTVIEIRAPDRIGLLYEIASVLQRHGVNIHLSKVDSVGSQVIDTFYVEKSKGGALDEELLSKVLNDLIEQVSQTAGLVP